MAQYKVVITDFGSPENEFEREEIANSGLDIELVRLNARVSADLFPTVNDADGLVVQWVQITEEVIAQLNKCKAISRYGIGVDMIDLSAAGKRGIPVFNTPDYCIEEVSNHTLGFLLMLNRRLLLQHEFVRAGKWGSGPVTGGAPMRLSKQTLGIVGLGNIGAAVAEKSRCFGVRLLAFDPYASPERFASLDVERASLDELLEQSDYVTLHCPLTDETRGLISTAQLARMKPTAYLINMARGAVVDQTALYQALISKTIAGAALDVLSKEPPASDDPLLKLDNVLFTPHTSSWSVESSEQLRRSTVRHIIDVLKGNMPRSVVNRKELGWADVRP
ncbi:MAG: C-terminal binding protein [Anaerolineae bacterium]